MNAQRTINLNFLDDLQFGFDSNGNGQNYEAISSIKEGPEPWFENENFSVIQKLPKGSEFIENGEYEDDQMYESRELGYTPPMIIDSASIDQDRKYNKGTQSFKSGPKSSMQLSS